MGTWGTGIFQDDDACDVRGEFRDLIGDGLTTKEATDRILGEYPSREDDPDVRSVVMIALAMTQWKTGRLLDEIRDQAIAAIDAGADLGRWEDQTLARRRENTLRKARSQLLSPQRAAVRIRKRVRSTTPFESGDVVVHTTEAGRKVVLWVYQNRGNQGGDIATRVEWMAADPDAVTLRPEAVLEASRRPHLLDGFLIYDCQKWPPERYSIVGRVPWPPARRGPAMAVVTAPSRRPGDSLDTLLDFHLGGEE